MEAIAWRIQTGDKKEFNYRLQVEGIKGIRAKNRVLKCVEDWSSAGEGFTKNKKEFVMIFSRTFDNARSWTKWTKQFPYNLAELKKDGTLKPIKRRVRR
mgnify:FL=1